MAGADVDLEARVRATVAIGGLARVAGFVAADDRIAVDAALDALSLRRGEAAFQAGTRYTV